MLSADRMFLVRFRSTIVLHNSCRFKFLNLRLSILKSFADNNTLVNGLQIIVPIHLLRRYSTAANFLHLDPQIPFWYKKIWDAGDYAFGLQTCCGDYISLPAVWYCYDPYPSVVFSKPTYKLSLLNVFSPPTPFL